MLQLGLFSLQAECFKKHRFRIMYLKAGKNAICIEELLSRMFKNRLKNTLKIKFKHSVPFLATLKTKGNLRPFTKVHSIRRIFYNFRTDISHLHRIFSPRYTILLTNILKLINVLDTYWFMYLKLLLHH